MGLICPSSRPQTPAVVARCHRLIAEMGFKPVVGKHVLSSYGFTAGTDEQRLADLHGFVEDDSIAAIFCLSGGYGALRLLPHLDFAAIERSRKLFVGGDDASCLLNAINAASGLVCLQALNLEQIKTKQTYDRLKTAVTSTNVWAPLVAAQSGEELLSGKHDFYCCVEGIAEGKLVGGNLTAFITLMGTPYQPDMNGKIIFLEDLGEQNGILDRWFTTLYLSGDLQYAAAVVFGSFKDCGPKNSDTMLSVMDLFGDRLQYLGKISCFGLPFGQQDDSYPVPIGVNARLTAAEGRLEFLEPALVLKN
ncbi:MAG TPA: LD-carboxypeptidase [Candidatus Obscuribacterales bacterium]